MNYISTRNKSLSVSSAEAIKKGLSDDGGLFVPSSIPSLSGSEIESLVNLGYIERAKYVLKKFLTDFTDEELKKCVSSAYGNNKFGEGDVVPLHKLSDNASVLELWHGPTCAFKDVALQILPHFLTAAMRKTGESKEIVILVATSGDTGKAALEGFKDVEGTRIAVFYPNDGVSDIQKLQMVTQSGKNVFVSSINGNFDDAQTGVKTIFTDDNAKKELFENNFILSSANSINWGRLVPQIVYYVSAYCDLLKNGEISMGDKINVCVPTGNFGNILAAYYAKKMGVPIAKLICASNRNDVLTDFIRTGEYNKNRKFYTTISPSMDILISSNLERLLFDISGGDDELIKNLMNKLSADGKYTLNDVMKARVSELFYGGCCDDNETKAQIADTFKKYGYTIDTHTAVAVNVYEKYVSETGDKTKTVIASTASPFKFGDSVLTALGESIDGKDDFELLDALCGKSKMPIPKSLEELKNKEQRFNGTCEKSDMLDEIKKFLNI